MRLWLVRKRIFYLNSNYTRNFQGVLFINSISNGYNFETFRDRNAWNETHKFKTSARDFYLSGAYQKERHTDRYAKSFLKSRMYPMVRRKRFIFLYFKRSKMTALRDVEASCNRTRCFWNFNRNQRRDYFFNFQHCRTRHDPIPKSELEQVLASIVGRTTEKDV